MGRKAFVAICAYLFIFANCSYGAWWIELSSPNPADGPFPLRWGQREPPDTDKVPFPPRWLINGDPCCFKVGATVRLSLKRDAPDPIHGWVVEWGVGYLTLSSKVTGQVLRTYPDAYFLPADQPYDFGLLVEWIEYAQLEMAVYVVYESGWAEEDYHGFVDEMFIVLDKPKAPMDPAWVNLLRYSCWWGRGTSNLDDAAQAITFGVFFHKIGDPSRPGFGYTTKTSWTDLLTNPPTLKLKAIFNEWNAGRTVYGNCLDISCFNMVALCSIGMDFSTRQLTGTLLSPPDPDAGNFRTNPICPIGSDPTVDMTYKPWAWFWHQICVLTGAPDPPSNDAGIWDPTAAQKEDLSGNGYRNPPAHHPNHQWPQKDYWQKPHTQIPGAWLGLVKEPNQGQSDPQHFGRGTWKCQVDTGPWP